MPTYEYQCKKCAHKFEAWQKISEEPLKNCPVCRGPLQRLISAGAGFIFKGPGFYSTDYRSKEYKEKQKKESKIEGATCPNANNNATCKQCPLSDKAPNK